MADRKISSQDWEQIFQDFRGSSDARGRWLSFYTPAGLVEQALQAVGSKKDFALKLQTLAFLDENAALLVADDAAALDLLLDTLRSTLQAPSSADGNSSSSSIKEQMMVTVTSTMVSIDAIGSSPRSLEILVEMLLVFINRPNHSSERHLRATACECLRELEKDYPCLLHSSAGHLLALCQSERTHAGQAYTLLLTSVLRNIALYMPLLRSFYAGTYSILFTTVPLIPFSISPFLSSVSSRSSSPAVFSSSKDFSEECMKEFRRVISFLLEKPSLLTECGVAEFISDVCRTASCLDLQPSLLKIQFWNLLHSFSPISCHGFLTILARFPDAFEGEESIVYKRLVLFSRELSQPLTVRLLAIHWLLGVENLVTSRGREGVLPLVAKSLYPEAFDPLSLKAAKLECLARFAVVFDRQQREGSSENFVRVMVQEDATDMASKLLKDGLVCLSSYKWLPPSSTETRLLFRTLHRFLVSGYEHSSKVVAVLEDGEALVDSLLFRSLQDHLVRMARTVRKLVDRILALLDRFLSCEAHHGLGERLLRTFSEDLVPALPSNSQLPAYFPLMERIAESGKIPPRALIKSLETYLRFKVGKHSGINAANYWLRGSEVLAICRTLLMHHQSSRVFRRLTELFGYLCLYFPDIEVRDNARFYLRMLISIPGNRLREILTYGESQTEDSKPQLLHVSSFLGSPSPRVYLGKKASIQVSSFIHLTRETPLLVRSSWSLVLHDTFQPILEPVTAEDQKPTAAEPGSSLIAITDDEVPGDSDHPTSDNVLRMMDAKTADTLAVLRRHFSGVSESGVKIQVVCRLKVKSLEAATDNVDAQNLAAIYAAVISFSTSGLYGPIPLVRVPFLLSEPSHKPKSSVTSPTASTTSEGTERRVKFLEPPRSSHPEEQTVEAHKFGKVVTIVLEPQQPVPTLVDCHIAFTDEDAQTVHGQLDSIPVGIEDLFMKPTVPASVSNEPEYLLSLFNALWYGCSGPGKLGTEIFLLKDGKQGLGLQGSESVKLLEAQADRVFSAVENYLAGFVVSVSGTSLKEMARYSGKFDKSCWIEEPSCSRSSSSASSQTELDKVDDHEQQQQQQLLDHPHHDPFSLESDLLLASEESAGGEELGCFMVLVFLPPRYHLLLRMEVSDWSTLIRIRTDYWPSLAHVDEFLESFVIPRTKMDF
ncbi:AP-5 complex subunit beta-1 [Selaginella moellendorffii]|uniref:AP-5 complex subunit beta-1 n=1 Tax=Selaginella moellendorffii TaxID=88036 RepID=UPI000D1C242C|nr:AP-5 complex subunit beta-1 [Selaginella moellendorffii]|eukprot:XP_024524086.1 AP-5 complex subunit beta-1 [Selaginella moellendorffii]